MHFNTGDINGIGVQLHPGDTVSAVYVTTPAVMGELNIGLLGLDET